MLEIIGVISGSTQYLARLKERAVPMVAETVERPKMGVLGDQPGGSDARRRLGRDRAQGGEASQVLGRS